MQPRDFIASLAAQDFENAFNPYADRCVVHDIDGAPAIRACTLRAILESAVASELDAIWIGRDLGYRGGRRTGLALTDDVHIAAHVERWGVCANRPTSGEAVAERTAAVIWRVLSHVSEPTFLWNVFPFHPHEPENPFSNRTHNARERDVGLEILRQLIALLRPRRLVAIGNDAAVVAKEFDDLLVVTQVRHPSYGGQSEFLAQMSKLYGLKGRGLKLN